MSRRLLMLAAMMAALSPLIVGGVPEPGKGMVQDLVVLLTDYGTCDFYVGALEGSIYSANPDARISAITHEVAAFNVAEGSYILAQAAREYPPGTVFAAEVDPGVGAGVRSIVLETKDGKIFVGPDNGLFTGVMDELGFAAVREVRNLSLTRRGDGSAAFKGVEVYGPVAGRLAGGVATSEVGPEIFDPVRIEAARAGIEDGVLVGAVAHVDHWGNLVTNIPHHLADEAGLAPNDSIEIAVGGNVVEAAFGSTYSDVPRGEMVAFVGFMGSLEIAINMDSAAEDLGASAGDSVRVRKVLKVQTSQSLKVQR